MNAQIKRRLDSVEKSEPAEKIKVKLIWRECNKPEPECKPGVKVIQLEWGDDEPYIQSQYT